MSSQYHVDGTASAELIKLLENISSHLSDSEKFSNSDWIQICAVVAAIITPLIIIFYEEKKWKKEISKQQEFDEKKKLDYEKEIVIALHCLLLGNLNALLAYKRQILNSLKGAAEAMENDINAINKQNDIHIKNTWIDNALNNVSTRTLCSRILGPSLTSLAGLLDKISFLSEKIPNTFVLIYTVNTLNDQYYKVSELRNSTIHTFKIDESFSISKIIIEWKAIVEQSYMLCNSVDDCLKYTNEALTRISLYLKKNHNYDKKIIIVEDKDLIPTMETFSQDNYLIKE